MRRPGGGDAGLARGTTTRRGGGAGAREGGLGLRAAAPQVANAALGLAAWFELKGTRPCARGLACTRRRRAAWVRFSPAWMFQTSAQAADGKEGGLPARFSAPCRTNAVCQTRPLTVASAVRRGRRDRGRRRRASGVEGSRGVARPFSCLALFSCLSSHKRGSRFT